LLREKVSEHGMVLLLSAPTGMDYYPKDGFQKENRLLWYPGSVEI